MQTKYILQARIGDRTIFRTCPGKAYIDNWLSSRPHVVPVCRWYVKPKRTEPLKSRGRKRAPDDKVSETALYRRKLREYHREHPDKERKPRELKPVSAKQVASTQKKVKEPEKKDKPAKAVKQITKGARPKADEMPVVLAKGDKPFTLPPEPRQRKELGVSFDELEALNRRTAALERLENEVYQLGAPDKDAYQFSRDMNVNGWDKR